jgi:hypothetical protein
MGKQSISKRNQILLDLVDDILKKCKQEDIEIRVIGGIGIFLKCPEYQELADTTREPFSDIDLITRKKHIEKIENLFESLGFEQNRNFKILFGYQRRIFYTPMNITVEVYLDDLPLCQDIKISDRICLDYPTLSVTDLLLSKIQRIKLKDKDIFDILILLASCNFTGENSNRIDLEYISRLCSKSWRWWKTFKINIDTLYKSKKDFLNNQGDISGKLEQVEHAIDSKKKSFGWKLRNLIGEKIRWYRYVEDTL